VDSVQHFTIQAQPQICSGPAQTQQSGLGRKGTHTRHSCVVSGKYGGAPLSLFFCPALEYAGVLGKGIIHKLLHTARLFLLGRLPQLVVVPLNPPVQKTNTLPAEELSRSETTLPAKEHAFDA